MTTSEAKYSYSRYSRIGKIAAIYIENFALLLFAHTKIYNTILSLYIFFEKVHSEKIDMSIGNRIYIKNYVEYIALKKFGFSIERRNDASLFLRYNIF